MWVICHDHPRSMNVAGAAAETTVWYSVFGPNVAGPTPTRLNPVRGMLLRVDTLTETIATSNAHERAAACKFFIER